MKIKQIDFFNLKIPFKTAFQHASATRNHTESVITQVTSQSGLTGYGEGCPRHYVTGESINTCFNFFKEFETEISGIISIETLNDWIHQHRSVIDINPTAWCSIELALLDLMAKEEGVSVETLLALPEISGSYEYTAVLGLNSLEAFKKQLRQYLAIGFLEYKVKISGNIDDDRPRIEAVFSILSEQSGIRLDANNVWTRAEEAIHYLEALNLPINAIEEPLSKNDFEGHRKIRQATGIPIILDESLCKSSQFENISNSPQSFIVNLRISKMGGILRSLAILEVANQMNIPVIVGAQVGETSLLSRAALTVVSSNRTAIIGQEGAFGTHLLEKDIAINPLIFGRGGRLTVVDSMKTPGLGVDINSELLPSVHRD